MKAANWGMRPRNAAIDPARNCSPVVRGSRLVSLNGGLMSFAMRPHFRLATSELAGSSNGFLPVSACAAAAAPEGCGLASLRVMPRELTHLSLSSPAPPQLSRQRKKTPSVRPRQTSASQEPHRTALTRLRPEMRRAFVAHHAQTSSGPLGSNCEGSSLVAFVAVCPPPLPCALILKLFVKLSRPFAPRT